MQYAITTTEAVFREVNINYSRKRKTPPMHSAEDVADFLRTVAPNNSQEHVLALYLDGGNQPIGVSVVSTGLASQCPIHPREVFQRAIALGASSLILAHNHPSGDPKPSKEDDSVTESMKEAGKVLCIRVLDHIILGDGTIYSYQSEGRM